MRPIVWGRNELDDVVSVCVGDHTIARHGTPRIVGTPFEGVPPVQPMPADAEAVVRFLLPIVLRIVGIDLNTPFIVDVECHDARAALMDVVPPRVATLGRSSRLLKMLQTRRVGRIRPAVDLLCISTTWESDNQQKDRRKQT